VSIYSTHRHTRRQANHKSYSIVSDKGRGANSWRIQFRQALDLSDLTRESESSHPPGKRSKAKCFSFFVRSARSFSTSSTFMIFCFPINISFPLCCRSKERKRKFVRCRKGKHREEWETSVWGWTFSKRNEFLPRSILTCANTVTWRIFLLVLVTKKDFSHRFGF
jgi:hypothetical protein